MIQQDIKMIQQDIKNEDDNKKLTPPKNEVNPKV